MVFCEAYLTAAPSTTAHSNPHQIITYIPTYLYTSYLPAYKVLGVHYLRFQGTDDEVKRLFPASANLHSYLGGHLGRRHPSGLPRMLTPIYFLLCLICLHCLSFVPQRMLSRKPLINGGWSVGS